MEEQFKNMDRLTKKYIKDAGMQKPSKDFLRNVMTALDEKPSTSIAYQPLISKKVWWGLAITAIACIVMLYLFPTSSISYVNDFDLTRQLTFKNPFEKLQFSKSIIYGIGFLGLSLVQIPFLKKYIEQRYH